MKNIHLKSKLITITNNFLKTVTSLFPKLLCIMILIILCLQQLSIVSLAAGEINNTTQNYTFDNLTSGNYEVYAVITDQANNQKVIGGTGSENDNKNEADANNGNVNGTTVTTKEMPNLTGADIEFTYEPTKWTSGSVKVTITDRNASAHTNLHLEYAEYSSSISRPEALDWKNLGEDKHVTTKNNETIYVRLSDDTNHSGYCTRHRC